MKTRKLRLLSFVLAVAMMFAVMPVSAFAEDGKKAIPSDGKCEVTVTKAGTAEKSAVQQAIEDTYEISNSNFDAIKSLTVTTASGVELDKLDFQFLSGVKVTEENAQYGWYKSSYAGNADYAYLKNLTYLDLSAAKCEDDTLPPRAFYQNGSIEQIILPESLKELKIRSLSAMTKLQTVGAAGVTLPDSIEILGESALAGNTELSGDLHLPASLKQLGSNCFYQTTKLTGNVVIGKDVSIKKNLYHGKDNSGNAVEKTSTSFFEGTKIESLKFEPSENITSIGEKFASGCTSLTNVVIPNTIAKIEKSAFSGCTGLTSITIPSSVTQIEEYAFKDCSKLKTVIFDGSKAQWEEVLRQTGVGNTAITDQTTTVKYNCTVTYVDEVGNGADTKVLKNGDKLTAPADPKADGNKFEGWYADNQYQNEFDFATATITNDTTIYAKWTPYNTKVDADVKANADPTSKTVEITVNVEAAPAELVDATATLNFTDANGNDDSANVVEVKVNGKTFNQNADGKYTAKLNALMPTPDASENSAEAVMLADVNEVVPSTTVNGTARLTVTYKTSGKHNVGIVLNAANGDVICKEIATVEIAPEPGTLNLTGCTAKLEDGTPVENGAKVPVGAEVTVTFEQDANSDLVLNGWNVTPETLTDTNGKLVKDITADTFTFVMPETDEGVTIEAVTKAKAAAPAEDDSLDAAAVVTGVVLGTGTAILAYHIGTEVYAEQVLGKGVAIPRTREEVALKAWELAGKPAVELNGEPLSEAAQAEKWAVESGLMQNVDGSFNGSKKMSKLKALRTLDAAKKLG